MAFQSKGPPIPCPMQFLHSIDDFFRFSRSSSQIPFPLFLKSPIREIICCSAPHEGAMRNLMANTSSKKGVIGILTGGGDVPGLNPAIRGVTLRALREGYQVIGIRHGWAGLVDMVREKDYDNSDNFFLLDEETVDRAGRTGGTFLHSSRTNPGRVAKSSVPAHLKDKFTSEKNDLTPEVLKNLAWLGIDTLIPIGGDDTLSYGVRLHKEGFKVIGIPKTMDNDVPETDYCIGFSTCVTRTIQMVNSLRTSAGSHERFMVIEVFGRYAGFTAMLPTMAGAANRCVIPEYKFNIEHLTELLVDDRRKNPSRYSIVLVSEGAMFEGGEMVFEGEATDAYGHKKLGGIGEIVGEKIKDVSAKFNNGKKIDVINQKLGRLVLLKNGHYDNIPLETVTATKKLVNVKEQYNTDRLRPQYASFEMRPLFLMTNEVR